jgi:hypothetical protein
MKTGLAPTLSRLAQKLSVRNYGKANGAMNSFLLLNCLAIGGLVTDLAGDIAGTPKIDHSVGYQMKTVTNEERQALTAFRNGLEKARMFTWQKDQAEAEFLTNFRKIRLLKEAHSAVSDSNVKA